MIDIAAFAGVGLEDGRKSFFELQQHGVVLAGHQQSYGTTRAHASDSHYFSRDVNDVVAIQNNAALGGKSFAVGVEHLDYVFLRDVAFARVINQREMVDDPCAAVYYVSNFRENVLGGLKPRLVLDLLPTFFCRLGLGLLDEHFGVHARVPYFQVAHVGVVANMVAIGANHSEHGIFAATGAETHFARGKDNAGGQALDVPFPGGLKRFVEIVDVEKKLALGAGKAAEIRRVTITAGLYANSRRGSFRKIPGHHCCRTAEERKRRLPHASVADGQKLGEAAMVGVSQHFDGIGAAGGRSPLGVRSAGDFFSKSFTRFHARFDTGPNRVRFLGSNTVNFSTLGTHRLGLIEGNVASDVLWGSGYGSPTVGASHGENPWMRRALAHGG